MDLQKHIDEGRIIIRQVDPAEWSPGEFSNAVRLAVSEHRSSVVIVDSLNGYLHSMPHERFLIIQLHEILTYLGQQGVATHPDQCPTRSHRPDEVRKSTPATWPTRWC